MFSHIFHSGSSNSHSHSKKKEYDFDVLPSPHHSNYHGTSDSGQASPNSSSRGSSRASSPGRASAASSMKDGYTSGSSGSGHPTGHGHSHSHSHNHFFAHAFTHLSHSRSRSRSRQVSPERGGGEIDSRPHTPSVQAQHDDRPEKHTRRETIGTGGYSDVLKAKWKARGGMLVAVKVVRKEAIRDNSEYLKIISTGFERIKNNSQDNQRVCYALDWFESPTKYYLTFPLLTGGELLQRLNSKGRFTESASKRVLRTMLDVLAFIHARGIVHRDIKPDNFLYRTPDSDVDDFLIIDFGISKILDTESEDDPKNLVEVAGTPGYAAPEIFRRTGYGKNADVFGVGVIAYNILSASSPWRSKDYVDLIKETLRGDPDFPRGPFKGVSEDAKNFVRWLMQPDPHRRPGARAALAHEWLSDRPSTSDIFPAPAIDHHDPPIHDDADRIPVPRPPTIKPNHPIAKQMTARGVESVLTAREEDLE